MAQCQPERKPRACCPLPGPASQLLGPAGCWLGFAGKALQCCSATPEGTRVLGFLGQMAFSVRAWTVQCITAEGCSHSLLRVLQGLRPVSRPPACTRLVAFMFPSVFFAYAASWVTLP